MAEPDRIDEVLGKMPLKDILKGVEEGRIDPGARAKPDPTVLPLRVHRGAPTVLKIPPAHEGVSFESYEPKTPSQTKALRWAQNWVEAALDGRGPMLALLGSPGVGKSHLLYSAVRALAAQRPTVKLYMEPWYELADRLRYMDWPELDRVRKAIERSDVVVIDEVRKTSGSEFDDTQLAKLAAWAWDYKKAMLITSNVHPLEAAIGPAAASRFTAFVVTGQDHRKKGKGTAQG